MEIKSGEESVLKFWEELGQVLEGCVRLSGLSAKELDSIWMNIRSLGQELSEGLLPPALRDQLTHWKPGSTICIATNENWIPWELLYDGDCFWGQKYILARLPEVPANRVSLSKILHRSGMSQNVCKRW